VSSVSHDDYDPTRHIRIPDDLWGNAQAAVLARGDPSLSYVIRLALTDYVDETRDQIKAARGGRPARSARHARREPPVKPPRRARE
jgi:hypothetical protein